VLSSRVGMAPQQLEALRARYPRNNRDLQPLHGRPVIAFPG